jgi:hypothetical protein
MLKIQVLLVATISVSGDQRGLRIQGNPNKLTKNAIDELAIPKSLYKIIAKKFTMANGRPCTK